MATFLIPRLAYAAPGRSREPQPTPKILPPIRDVSVERLQSPTVHVARQRCGVAYSGHDREGDPGDDRSAEHDEQQAEVIELEEIQYDFRLAMWLYASPKPTSGRRRGSAV